MTIQKMNPDVKQKWVNELRSGKYQQCAGQLSDGEGFCCLGVLTDLHRKAMKKGKDNYVWDDGFPPDAVLKWAGIPTNQIHGENDIKITSSGKQWATSYNDNGASFKQIASFIEKNL